ncbi:hypothetical protein ACXR2U_23845, partial [Jatrophihabitans sp. YIM 134969]
MASSAEQALAETTNVPNETWRAQRAEYTQQAIQYMNQLAADMKSVPGRMNWTGPASQDAEQKFGEYGTKVAGHADTLAAVDAADAQAAAAVSEAQQDYDNLPPAKLSDADADAANKNANFHPGSPDADSQNAQLAAARAQKAQQDKQKLDSSMGQADSDVRSNVSWDMGDIDPGKNAPSTPPSSGGSPSGTMPPGSVPGGGGGTGNSASVWGQGPTGGGGYNPEGPGGVLIGCPGYVPVEPTGPGQPPTTVGQPGGVSVDGPTQGTIPGGGGSGGYGGVGGIGGLGAGGSGGLASGGSGGLGGTGGMGGMGGVAGVGGVVAGGAGLAAGGFRSGGGG